MTEPIQLKAEDDTVPTVTNSGGRTLRQRKKITSMLDDIFSDSGEDNDTDYNMDEDLESNAISESDDEGSIDLNQEIVMNYEPGKKRNRKTNQPKKYFNPKDVSNSKNEDDEAIGIENEGGRKKVISMNKTVGDGRCNILGCTTKAISSPNKLPAKYNYLPYQQKQKLSEKYGLIGIDSNCCNTCLAAIMKDIDSMKDLPVEKISFNEQLKKKAVGPYTICQKCLKICNETLAKLVIVSNEHIKAYCPKCLKGYPSEYDVLNLKIKEHATLLRNYKASKVNRLHHRNSPSATGSSVTNNTNVNSVINATATATNINNVSITNSTSKVTVTPVVTISATKIKASVTTATNEIIKNITPDSINFSVNDGKKRISLINKYIQNSTNKNYNGGLTEFFNLVCHSESAVIKGFFANVTFSKTSFSVFNFCEVSGCINVNIKAWLSGYDPLIQLIPRDNNNLVDKTLKMFRLKAVSGECCCNCFSNMKYYIAYLTGQLLLKIDRTNNKEKTHVTNHLPYTVVNNNTAPMERYNSKQVLQQNNMQNTHTNHVKSSSSLSIMRPVTTFIQPKPVLQTPLRNQKTYLTKENPLCIQNPFPVTQNSPPKAMYPSTVRNIGSMKLRSPNKNLDLQMPVIGNTFSLQNLPKDSKSTSSLTFIDALYQKGQPLTMYHRINEPNTITNNLTKPSNPTFKTTNTNTETLIVNMSKSDALPVVSTVIKSEPEIDPLESISVNSTNTLKDKSVNSTNTLNDKSVNSTSTVNDKSVQDCTVKSTPIVLNQPPTNSAKPVDTTIPQVLLSTVKVEEDDISNFVDIDLLFNESLSTSEHNQNETTAYGNSTEISKGSNTSNKDSNNSFRIISSKESNVSTNLCEKQNPDVAKGKDIDKNLNSSVDAQQDTEEPQKVIISSSLFKIGKKVKSKLSSQFKSKLTVKTNDNLKEALVKKNDLSSDGSIQLPIQNEINDQPTLDKSCSSKEINFPVASDCDVEFSENVLEQGKKLLKEFICELHVISKGEGEKLFQELFNKELFDPSVMSKEHNGNTMESNEQNVENKTMLVNVNSDLPNNTFNKPHNSLNGTPNTDIKSPIIDVVINPDSFTENTVPINNNTEANKSINKISNTTTKLIPYYDKTENEIQFLGFTISSSPLKSDYCIDSEVTEESILNPLFTNKQLKTVPVEKNKEVIESLCENKSSNKFPVVQSSINISSNKIKGDVIDGVSNNQEISLKEENVKNELCFVERTAASLSPVNRKRKTIETFKTNSDELQIKKTKKSPIDSTIKEASKCIYISSDDANSDAENNLRTRPTKNHNITDQNEERGKKPTKGKRSSVQIAEVSSTDSEDVTAGVGSNSSLSAISEDGVTGVENDECLYALEGSTNDNEMPPEESFITEEDFPQIII